MISDSDVKVIQRMTVLNC